MSICIHLQAFTQILHLLGQHLRIHRWCPTSLWTGSTNRSGLPRRASRPIPWPMRYRVTPPFVMWLPPWAPPIGILRGKVAKVQTPRFSWWSTSSCSSYLQCFWALFLPVYTPWRSPSRLVIITSKNVPSTTRVFWTVTTRQSCNSTLHGHCNNVWREKVQDKWFSWNRPRKRKWGWKYHTNILGKY